MFDLLDFLEYPVKEAMVEPEPEDDGEEVEVCPSCLDVSSDDEAESKEQMKIRIKREKRKRANKSRKNRTKFKFSTGEFEVMDKQRKCAKAFEERTVGELREMVEGVNGEDVVSSDDEKVIERRRGEEE